MDGACASWRSSTTTPANAWRWGRHIDLANSGRARTRRNRRGARSARRNVSDNGTELTSTAILAWSDRQKAALNYIAPGKPAFIGSFNGRPRDELLNETLFRAVPHARAALNTWRWDYNAERPHSSLGWQTPLAFASARRCRCAQPDRTLPRSEGFAPCPVARMTIPPGTRSGGEIF